MTKLKKKARTKVDLQELIDLISYTNQWTHITISNKGKESEMWL